MGIYEIEQAVMNLSTRELALFRQWFEKFDAQLWDRQIAADVKSGKLDRIAEKALAEYHAGEAKGL
jgi:hypothetical protein